MNKQPIGKLLREFGVRGDLKAKIYIPPFYLKNYKSVFIEDVEFEIEKVIISEGQYAIIKFKDIKTREDAKRLKGKEIFIYENLLPPKEEGEYYVYELENLKVYYKGSYLGFVKSVIVQGNYVLLLIKTQNDEIFIPFSKRFIESIDLSKKVCILREDLDEAIINP
ncbi:MAG: ribosome maturation factor RimM [candidate division WOR-3 bacterium]